MAVRSDSGWLSVTFQFKGKRRVEYVGLKDTRDNRRFVQKLNDQIKAELKLGRFKYEKHFPNSKHAKALATAPVYSGPTLKEFAETWLTELVATAAPGTIYDYKIMLRKHLFGHPLVNKPIRTIHDGDIKTYLADLKAARTAEGYAEDSNRRINMVLARLRTIFHIASRRRGEDGLLLVTTDPMKFVDNLRQMKTEIDPLNMKEVDRLLWAAEGQFRNLLTVLIFTGMRPGEALGLKWADIDRDRGMIRIRRTLNRRLKESQNPKTRGSERDVEMNATVRAALADQRALTGLAAGSMGNGLVFASENGKPIDLGNIRMRDWARTLARARIRPRPLYQCRHTYATLLLEAGAQPQYVSSQLGHKSLEMLFNVYSRWLRPPTSTALMELDTRLAAVREARR